MMKAILVILALGCSAVQAAEQTVKAPVAKQASADENPRIDMKGYLRVSAEAAKHRETRRVSEEEFIKMSGEAGTLVLDARSAAKYAELHVKGAISLPFPDIAVESIKKTIPDQNTRILIYCNNNFLNAEESFATKVSIASLNISTYISLYTYGYRNVYELKPLIDLPKSKLEFEGTKAAPKKAEKAVLPVHDGC